MTPLSSRQLAAFANPAKAACRESNLRVLREAACRYSCAARTMNLISWPQCQAGNPQASNEVMP